jgi:hypothetical protein
MLQAAHVDRSGDMLAFRRPRRHSFPEFPASDLPAVSLTRQFWSPGSAEVAQGDRTSWRLIRRRPGTRSVGGIKRFGWQKRAAHAEQVRLNSTAFTRRPQLAAYVRLDRSCRLLESAHPFLNVLLWASKVVIQALALFL